ncbi:unnamed protein product [Cochlearia groenlandica]
MGDYVFSITVIVRCLIGTIFIPQEKIKLIKDTPRIETKNWVVTAFGKAGKDGVVVDYDLVRSFVPPKDATEEAAKGQPEIAETEKSALPTVQVGAVTANPVHSGERSQTVAGTARSQTMAVAKIPVNRQDRFSAAVGPKVNGLDGPKVNGLNGPKGNGPEGNGPNGPFRADNALTRAGPLGFGSTPVRSSWYEQTVEEEEAAERAALVADGPSSAPGGSEAMPRGRGKKVKSFQNALLPRKKIVNSSSRKGKILNKYLLSMTDFDVVARAKGLKEGPDKGVCLTNDALVGGVPPVKD